MTGRGALLMAVALTAVLLGSWTATEWIAWRLRFHPNLGLPLWSWRPTSHPPLAVYWPTQLVVWEVGYRAVPRIARVLREGMFAFGGATAVLLAIGAAVVPRGPRRPVPCGSAGTAEWGTGADLVGTRGLVLGRQMESRT